MTKKTNTKNININNRTSCSLIWPCEKSVVKFIDVTLYQLVLTSIVFIIFRRSVVHVNTHIHLSRTFPSRYSTTWKEPHFNGRVQKGCTNRDTLYYLLTEVTYLISSLNKLGTMHNSFPKPQFLSNKPAIYF